MEDEERAGRAHEVLVRAVADHPQRDGTTVRLTSNEGPSALIETLRLLDANALTPATLTVREPSLDDAFLALTGAASREAATVRPEARSRATAGECDAAARRRSRVENERGAERARSSIVGERVGRATVRPGSRGLGRSKPADTETSDESQWAERTSTESDRRSAA